MAGDSDQPRKTVTDRLTAEDLRDMSFIEQEITFRPFPDARPPEAKKAINWRVRFDLATDSSVRFGLDINGDVTLGRGGETLNTIDLSPYRADEYGVSRRHAMLRPSSTALYLVDLGSTNGTLRNGQSIGVNTPFSLSNGDTITLGRLQFVVWIIDRPSGRTRALEKKADLADALAQVGKAITSQLDLDAVLNQVTEAAMTVTDAGETGIWLVDEETGELFLEAQHGIEDEKIQRMRIPISGDSLAAKVIKTGKPLRASRQPGEAQIKIKTGYLVEALLYVPITLGGVTFGVLAAAHREETVGFSDRELRLLEAIADFAAIAIQNARTYRSTDQALARRVEDLMALNELSFAVSTSLDLDYIHKVLIEKLRGLKEIENAVLWLVNRENGKLEPYNQSEQISELIHRTGDQIPDVVKTVVDKEAPVVAGFLDMDQAFQEADGQSTSTVKAKSLVGLPLLAKESTIGALALIARRGVIQDQDLARLQAFANPVAVAIENARLYAQAEYAHATILATAETLPQPMLILDDQGRVLLANQSANEILEKHMSQLFEGISEGVGRTTEIKIDSSTYLATIEHSTTVGTIVVMQDITYVKELEKEQSEMVRALSHDLKSPLTSVKGWAQLVKQVSELDDRPAGYVEHIIDSADRMLSMISSLLTSATASRSARFVRAPCALEESVTRAIADLRGAALAKAISVEMTVTGIPYKIIADSSRLYHLALNLVDNAIKYSPKHTTVNVGVAYTNAGVTLSVADEGEGIPEDDLSRIFDHHYRSEKHSHLSGTGVGLTIVKAVSKAHDGDVIAANRASGGAIFTVKLPATLRSDE
ncbi:MAG: GAF domain-containing protein [Anaerolineae bacterium]|nr:GAF domain-containing protein [Anaerolineae bacterium]